MVKKELKIYEIPTLDIVELEESSPILAGSSDPSTNPFHDSTEEPEEV
jgi:hypothetical protein